MSTLNPTPQVTARVIVQQTPDIGQDASSTIDTAVINPVVLLGGSGIASTFNQVLTQTRRIAANDTDIAFDYAGNPVLIAIVGTGQFKLRLADAETQLTGSAFFFAGNGSSLGTVPFLVDGNGADAVDVTVAVWSKTS